jgi:hypothetical protein
LLESLLGSILVPWEQKLVEGRSWWIVLETLADHTDSFLVEGETYTKTDSCVRQYPASFE